MFILSFNSLGSARVNFIITKKAHELFILCCTSEYLSWKISGKAYKKHIKAPSHMRNMKKKLDFVTVIMVILFVLLIIWFIKLAFFGN
tara:strand:- start:496 stop:759 length:264 start_codon:yes stop_codon:yes gene_type:complete